MLGVVVRERGAGGSEETGAVVRRRGRPNPQNPGPVVPAFGGYPPKPRQRAAEGASVYSDTREQRARTPPVAARSQHRGTFARAGQPTAHICRAPHSKPARCAQQMSLPTSSALHNRLDIRFVHSSPPGVPAAASSEQRAAPIRQSSLGHEPSVSLPASLFRGRPPASPAAALSSPHSLLLNSCPMPPCAGRPQSLRTTATASQRLQVVVSCLPFDVLCLNSTSAQPTPALTAVQNESSQ